MEQDQTERLIAALGPFGAIVVFLAIPIIRDWLRKEPPSVPSEAPPPERGLWQGMETLMREIQQGQEWNEKYHTAHETAAQRRDREADRRHEQVILKLDSIERRLT